DGRYTEQSRREVPDVDRVTYTGAAAAALGEAAGRIGATRVAFEPEHLSYQAWTELSGAGLDLLPVRGQVEALRAVKDAQEIALIEAAQDAADQALETVTAKLADGVTEREVAFELE